jgi:hypothetical protein
MTRGTAAAAVISRLIVGAGERQQGIEEAGFLQTEEHRIGPQQRAEAALAQLHLRASRLLFPSRIANFPLLASASFEHAQHVARL